MSDVREIRSKGRSITLPLSELRLDPFNPRLPADKQGESQEELAVYLEMSYEALVVAESIASHGYFGSEPLIVIEHPDEPRAWIVVEGNRRLTALLGLTDAALRNQFPNPTRWEALAASADIELGAAIPAVVLPDRSAATPIIGFRHISGILQWQPYAQARYIAGLVDDDGMTFKEVADMIGIDRTKVSNLYRDQAIAAQAKDFGIETGPLEESFSLLTVAMSSNKLRDHVGAPVGSKTVPGEPPIDPGKKAELKELITWIYGDGETAPVINDSREISKLGNVVASPRGLDAVRSGKTLEESLQVVKDAETNPRARLLQRLRAGRNSLTAALEDVADFHEDDDVREAVDEARAAADALLNALERD
jgi:hypothetical protein